MIFYIKWVEKFSFFYYSQSMEYITDDFHSKSSSVKVGVEDGTCLFWKGSKNCKFGLYETSKSHTIWCQSISYEE